MFELKRQFGQHKVLTLDTHKHQFREFFENLYETKDLEHLHLASDEFKRDNLCDVETSLHKKFYTEIKSNENFKKIYCLLVKDLFDTIYSTESELIYQSFPSIRMQFVNNVSVPPHYDSDDLGKHPLGEENFLLPITEMKLSRRLFIESEPGKKDFEGIDLDYGELLYFNGNRCTHYNQKKH